MHDHAHDHATDSAPRICVAGAGAWGTALAILAARAGGRVTLLARSPAHAMEIEDARENARRLPRRALPEGLRVTHDPALAAAGAALLLLVTPSQAIGATCALLEPHLPRDALALVCAKGVERASGRLLSAVAAEALPGREVGALSGPSFADEAADGLPTAVLVAARDLARAQAACAMLATGGFRPYAGRDVIGAELGGAAKNVIAIACGAAEGLGLGANARAALISRGLAEIAALGAAMGAEPATLAGLSGVGDLVLTCTSAKSRNFAYGRALGEAGSLDALEESADAPHALAEGAVNAASVSDLGRAHGVAMPIVEAVRAVLERRLALPEAIAALLERPLRDE